MKRKYSLRQYNSKDAKMLWKKAEEQIRDECSINPYMVHIIGETYLRVSSRFEKMDTYSQDVSKGYEQVEQNPRTLDVYVSYGSLKIWYTYIIEVLNVDEELEELIHDVWDGEYRLEGFSYAPDSKEAILLGAAIAIEDWPFIEYDSTPHRPFYFKESDRSLHNISFDLNRNIVYMTYLADFKDKFWIGLDI